MGTRTAEVMIFHGLEIPRKGMPRYRLGEHFCRRCQTVTLAEYCCGYLTAWTTRNASVKRMTKRMKTRIEVTA